MFIDGKTSGVGDGLRTPSDQEHKNTTPDKGDSRDDDFDDLDESWFSRGDRLSRRREE